MRRRNRIGITCAGFAEYAEKINRLGGNVDEIVEKALKASFNHVTPKLETAINRHVLTGDTNNSLKRTPATEKTGRRMSVKVGFQFPKGLPSIFLMYGTPKVKKDRKLYDAVYSRKTQREIKEIQQEIFSEEIRRLMR